MIHIEKVIGGFKAILNMGDKKLAEAWGSTPRTIGSNIGKMVKAELEKIK